MSEALSPEANVIALRGVTPQDQAALMDFATLAAGLGANTEGAEQPFSTARMVLAAMDEAVRRPDALARELLAKKRSEGGGPLTPLQELRETALTLASNGIFYRLPDPPIAPTAADPGTVWLQEAYVVRRRTWILAPNDVDRYQAMQAANLARRVVSLAGISLGHPRPLARDRA